MVAGGLVEGQEVWEEWSGQAVEDAEWRKKPDQGAVEGNGANSSEKGLGK